MVVAALSLAERWRPQLVVHWEHFAGLSLALAELVVEADCSVLDPADLGAY